MTGYAQLRNDLWSNEKMRRIGEEHPHEFALWIISISYCSDKLTDGMLTPYAIRKILGVKPARQRRMLELNLWEKRGENVYVHDYLESQNSREEIERSRASNARRQAEWRERRRGGDDAGDASRNALRNDSSNGDITRENLKPKTYKPKTNKEREEKDPSPSMVDVDGWEPKRSHFESARELSERGYPLVDVTDLGVEFKLSLKAKGLDHYGYRDLDAAFAQWVNKRAKSMRDAHQVPGFAPVPVLATGPKSCHHTWKCRHVLELLHRDEASADADTLAQHAADLLNQGKTAVETLETLGLAVDETEAIA